MSHSLHGECDVESKEQTRLQVLNSLLAEHMTLDQAATLMGVSSSAHQAHPGGLPGEGSWPRLPIGHRGRRAPNATPEAVAYDVVHLARTRYSGPSTATHCSASMLDEREGIDRRQDHAQTHPWSTPG